MNANFYYRAVETRSGKQWTPRQPREKSPYLRKPEMRHTRRFRVDGGFIVLGFCGALR